MYDEIVNFKKLSKEYTKDDFKNAMRGLLSQKEMYATNQLRPKHLLEDGNLDKYIDSHINKKQLFEDKKQTKSLGI